MKLIVEEIAKVIAGNYADWKSYTGKAEKVIKYIEDKQNKQKDMFL